MADVPSHKFNGELLLVVRILLTLLFLISGFNKLSDHATTIGYMNRLGVPMPQLAAFVATWVEIILPIAVVVGWVTRRVALILAIYTLATAMIGHRFWGTTGLERDMNEIQFLKNICIVAGFILLHMTGPGEYSIDAQLEKRYAAKHITPS